MKIKLFGTSSIKRKAKKLAVDFRNRVTADGGVIQNYAFVVTYYEFMLRNFGTIPRRVYSSLAGVKLNGGNVSKWYDLNPISQIDATQSTPANQASFTSDSDVSHNVLVFDGVSDTLLIDDLSIFTNQPIGNLWAIAKDTAPSTSGAHNVIVVRTATTTARAVIGTRGSTADFRAGGRRKDTDTFKISESPNNGNFNTINAKLNWTGDVATLTLNKEDKTPTDFAPSVNGNSDTTVSNAVEISGDGLYPGIIAECHLDRSIYTQAQINALHEFFKQYYPTLS